MSDTPNPEFDLELTLLPAWAKESTDTNRYAHYRGDEGERPERGRGRGRDGDRRGPRPGGFGGGGFGGERRGPRPEGRGPGGPRREGGRPGGDRGPRGPRRDDRGEGRGRFTRPEPRDLPPLPELKVEVIPDPTGVESIAKQIKLTGRCYPLFDIAGLVMKRPERYGVRFDVVKKAEGKVAQPLFVCSLDDTVWLSEEDAIKHMIEKHLGTFYQTDKIPCDPPKGAYTLVAQCGMSGVILGPPNYHDYQTKLAKLHQERFARMPFDVFKSRVKMVREEAVVKQWVEEQSFKTEYTALNVPEPVKFTALSEVEKHFRATHVGNLVQSVEAHTVSGVAAAQLRSAPLRTLARNAVEEQKRFPMKVANRLSTDFARAGLQFFKVNKQYVHVSVARPHYLDLEATPVSDSIRKIIEFLNAHAKCTRKMVMEALVPAPAASVPSTEATPAAAAAPEGAVTPAPAAPEPTPEQKALSSDLHWLIHQGHVIEFANGQIETAKKPLPKPIQQKADRAGYLPVFNAAPLLLG